MTNFLLELVFYATFTVIGAFWIDAAVDNYKHGRYFRFGFDVMMTFFECACLAEMIFKS